jgi:hypothetical protein
VDVDLSDADLARQRLSVVLDALGIAEQREWRRSA